MNLSCPILRFITDGRLGFQLFFFSLKKKIEKKKNDLHLIQCSTDNRILI